MGGIDRQRDGESRAPAEPCRTCFLRDETQYRSLVRLAALLTGDAETAETVTADAMLAGPCSTRAHHSSEHCLGYLQQQVVVRSRRRRYRPWSERQGPAVRPVRNAPPRREPPTAPEFSDLPVVAALRRLRPPVREAVVLTYYLDLPAAKAAAIAGVSEAALRANLAAAMRALTDQITPGPGL
jgi:Sigma-70, region 4